MKKINILDPKISNMIAAGEVVERPSSVVKELLENAIDAGAQAVTVEIKKGGITYIRVSDNGSGIDQEDAVIAFQRHATSKIQVAEDLDAITTLGFRGEALASISAVSHVELITKTSYSAEGTHVIVKAGKIIKQESIGCPQGTTVVVRNLFYNTPARMKFLKKDATEAGYISDIINRMILGHPEISFKYINNGKEVTFTPGDNNLTSCVYALYGKDFVKSMIPIDHFDGGIKITGLVGKADTARANRNFQSFFINGRYIKSKILTYAVEEAYKNMLTVKRFPTVILYLNINPMLIDVNVHPTKMEIKFSDEKQVYQTVYWAVKNALYSQKHVPEVTLPKKKGHQYILNTDTKNNDFKDEWVQEQIRVSKPVVLHTSKESAYNIPSQGGKTPNIKTQSVSFQEQTTAFNNKQNLYDAELKYSQTTCDNKNNIETNFVPVVSNHLDFKIIGQVFNTYIIVEKDGEMLLIDQHAAHERLMYEQLMLNRKNHQVVPQTLLVPVVIILSDIEFNIVKENMEFFKNIGFEVEDFGNNSIVIRQTPVDFQEQELKDLFIEIIEILQKSNKKEVIMNIEERALYTVACKAAIKANKTMHIKEMEKLIGDLLKMQNINTCPHGRPIVISMSKYYIEKQFKRIQ
ncbi:MAG: mismatch repair protein MutL [Clostridiales bacterium]|jgi:DNA mismatch repair protein MutL|nr:mismatch repair protein MutL [Clostridiales bacterium]MDK2932432.1 mismatch repair protein MutL [Clostridiales bacterium]